jgi:hypothetical protein
MTRFLTDFAAPAGTSRLTAAEKGGKEQEQHRSTGRIAGSLRCKRGSQTRGFFGFAQMTGMQPRRVNPRKNHRTKTITKKEK